MFTIATSTDGTHEVAIVLEDGTVAGVGAGRELANAMYFACISAARSGHYQAACGHSREMPLTSQDESSVRAACSRHAAAVALEARMALTRPACEG